MNKIESKRNSTQYKDQIEMRQQKQWAKIKPFSWLQGISIHISKSTQTMASSIGNFSSRSTKNQRTYDTNLITQNYTNHLEFLAKFWNCIPIILQNYWKASINYLLFPYFAMAYLGLVLNISMAFIYSGFVNSVLILLFVVTCYKKLSVIHWERVYQRQLFIFMAYWTYFIQRGFAFLFAFTSVIFGSFGLLLDPPLRKPFFIPPYPSPASLAAFYFFFSISKDIFYTFLFKLSNYFFCYSSSMYLGSGFAQSSLPKFLGLLY